jgi:hypothetical protein
MHKTAITIHNVNTEEASPRQYLFQYLDIGFMLLLMYIRVHVK